VKILRDSGKNNDSIPKKPYIKGKHWIITTISLDDNYHLVYSYHPVRCSYHPMVEFQRNLIAKA